MHHHLIDVFVSASGTGGNALAVFVEADVDAAERQGIAAELGLSETVFVDDAGAGRLQIFTPASELAFAGHPLGGTAWLLAELGRPVDVLRPPAGDVATWAAGGMRWIRGHASWAPDFDFRQVASPAAVDAATGAPEGSELPFYVWAWADERAGVVRSRMFAPSLGIAEDEATGAAAVRLADLLGHALPIHQGVGSELRAVPVGDGWVELGGHCRAGRRI